MNAVEIEAAISDLAFQPFDAVEFPFAFLTAFGNKDTALKRLRTGNNNASDVPGGVLQRNNIHIAVCAEGNVGQTLKALRASPATTKAKAKFILATDGLTLEAEELLSGETIACAYSDFPNHFGFFLPLAGISTIKEIKDNPIDVRATGRLNKLYVELLRENPDWAKDERRHDMNHFMARLVFCFFAEDTDIFNDEGLFTRTVEQMSERDGTNTHEVLETIFRAMNIKTDERINARPRLPVWADRFPYVNGGLFSGSTEVPRFTRMARTYLLHAGGLNWKQINPDIFGSMIQAVADDEERGALGMHYTSVPNILKVLNPLFLDDLRAQLTEAGDNERKLLNLRKRMAHIRVFDPACGSGNFLVIAYKKMREIEAEINRRLGKTQLGSEIPLTNFRGIELRDFPAEIARLALIIAEFQCDVLYRGQKAADYGTQTNAAAAFVSTNSICQGQQVPILWPLIFGTGNQITFAHTSFKWANLASHNAGVTVVIVAIAKQNGKVKRLFSVTEEGATIEKQTDFINAYLISGFDVIVSPKSKSDDSRGLMEWGNKPTVGGNLLLSSDEREKLLRESPSADRFVKRFVGAQEFIQGEQRYCLWIEDEEREDAEAVPELKRRVEAVAKMRSDSKAAETRPAAAFPHRFRQIQSIAKAHTLVLGAISSENRDYLPCGLLPSNTIISNKCYAIYDAPLWNMALIASRLHWVWIGTVCVRMRTDFSYSNTLGWNTFPVPLLTEQNKADLTACAEAILLAREAHFPATIADLYDPDTMPENLRHAHERNDEVLERIYIGRRFRNDTERLEKLFELYTKMTAAGIAKPTRKLAGEKKPS
jgi:hypothetical protein